MNRGEASWLGLLEYARSLDPDPELQHLTDDDLQREVRDGASRLAALECEWLLLVGELVVRGVWADEGARTPGQWLSFTCSMDGSTAREKVRVALALRELPGIRARFAAGTLSYSKVRALTRVATPEIEDDLIRLADSAPASEIVRLLAAGRRSADELLRWEDGPPASPAGEVWGLQRLAVGDGVVEYRLRVPAADSMAVDERLDRLVEVADRADRADRGHEGQAEDGALEESPAPPPGEGEAGLSRGARRAVAMVDALATAVAAGPPDRSGCDDHLVVVHVDAAELAAAVADPDGAMQDDEPAPAASADAPRQPRQSGQPRRGYVTTGRQRGMMLPRRVLARLACDADLRVAGADGDGHPADIGRRSRKIPADLRRALLLRDRHCRFPGCHATRGLHAHHVVHWAEGGPTDLSNLSLLCGQHHRFVHDRAWEMRPVAGRPGRWTFHAPGSNRPLEAVRAMPGASADAPDGTRDTAPPPLALQPPWWDGGPYDVDETVRIISEVLLDVAA